jgi:ubiquinol-cytochrome c reductase cytochrome c1 subunit
MATIEPPASKDAAWVVKTMAIDRPGTMSPVEYRAAMKDLVNFLDYLAEPAKLKRQSIGILVLIFLGLFFVVAYWLKKEYWKDVR